MRRRFSWRMAVGGTFLVLLFLVLTTARGGDRRLYPARADAVTVFLVDNGWHSDLALPRAALDGDGPAGRSVALAGRGPWVMAGFGDTRFFLAKSPPLGRAGDGLRALFAADNPAAIRFDVLADRPDRLWRDGVTPLRLSRLGLAALVRRIDRSIALDSAGRPRPEAPPADATVFVRSRETFSLAHLCNHWTAELLAAAGLPTTPVLDTLPPGLKADLALRAGVALDNPRPRD